MAEIGAQRTEQADLVASLGFPRDAMMIRLKGLAEIRDRAYTLTRTLGVQAVNNGSLTRVDVGRTVGVHPVTVAKWVNEAAEQPDRDYVADPFNAAHHQSPEETR